MQRQSLENYSGSIKPLSSTHKIWSDIKTQIGSYKPKLIDSLSFNNDLLHDRVDITNAGHDMLRTQISPKNLLE